MVLLSDSRRRISNKSELAAVIPEKWPPKQIKKANPIAQINTRRARPARRKTLSKLQAADGLETLARILA
jgi:hypothetical protein